MTLLEKTLQLLADSPESLNAIAAGSNVGYEWLKKLAEGSIPNPGVIRVQSVHDYLASRAVA
jgi:hypothetical protein